MLAVSRDLKRRVAPVFLLVAAAAVAAFGLVLGAAEPDSSDVTAEHQAAGLRSAARAWRWEGYGLECPTFSRLLADGFVSPRERSVDPWGTAFAIECVEGQVHVRSAGPDRRFDTADDVRSPSE